MVRRRARRTVRWAVRALKRVYFTRNPKRILDIWLFKNRASYLKHTWQIFKERPSTPFGYYSSAARALIMNVATGGGTLVHEIVHPFIEANFPGCPPWFNEGLASLYEQCGDRRGRIVGFTNWRLAGLQRAIRRGKVPPFRKLMSRNRHQFYQQDRGTNYGQSRYLCYYLQEQGKLGTYYREFLKNRRSDPTGYGTLKRVLGVSDLAAFQRRWQAWVLDLRYP